MNTKRHWVGAMLFVAFAAFATTGFTFAGQDNQASIMADHISCEQVLADPSFFSLEHLGEACLALETDQTEREIDAVSSSTFAPDSYVVDISSSDGYGYVPFFEEWAVDQVEREIDAGFLSSSLGSTRGGAFGSASYFNVAD